VLAAFAIKVAVPAPVLVTHRHDGGEHEHFHAETVLAHDHGDHLHDDHHHHDDADHHHHAAPTGHGAVLAHLDPHGEHSHWQLPFHRIAWTPIATAFVRHALPRVIPPEPRDPAATPVGVPRSRGPPPSSAAE
jgi:hypothetical protein